MAPVIGPFCPLLLSIIMGAFGGRNIIEVTRSNAAPKTAAAAPSFSLHPPSTLRRTELNGRATRVSSRCSRSRRWPTAAWLVASRFRAVCDTAERADGGDACCVLACRVLAVVIDGRRPRYGCVLWRLAARLPSFATTLLACGAPCLPARQRGFSCIQVAVRHSDGRG